MLATIVLIVVMVAGFVIKPQLVIVPGVIGLVVATTLQPSRYMTTHPPFG